MKNILLALAFLIAGGVTAARAEITPGGTAGHMDVRYSADVSASPTEVWRRIGQIDRWWEGGHSYSENPRNFHLEMRAGGCWCEVWSGGSVQHMRVVMAISPQYLRMEGALGPLQQRAVTGVMTFALVPQNGHTHISLTYIVSGDQSEHLDQVAPDVDHVLGEQFERLVHLIQAGAAH